MNSPAHGVPAHRGYFDYNATTPLVPAARDAWLEAQACAIPVMCANTSSLPEVAGEGALLVDPLDTAGMAEIAAYGSAIGS